MNPFNDTQLKSLRNVRLSDSEKGVMRRTLQEEMAKVPLRAEAGVRMGEQERYQLGRTDINNNRGPMRMVNFVVAGPLRLSRHMRICLPRHISRASNFTHSNKSSKSKIMPITLLIALIMGGSVSYAAEGTLPGDTLYPVKIHVNESIRSALAVSSASQAALEIELAERRLSEAKQLEAEGRLDVQTKLELRGQVEEYSERAEVETDDNTAAGTESDAEVEGDFTVKLNAIGDMIDVLEVTSESRGELGERSTTQQDKSEDTNTSNSTTSQYESELEIEAKVEVRGDTDAQHDTDDEHTSTSGSVDATTQVKTTIPVVITAP